MNGGIDDDTPLQQVAAGAVTALTLLVGFGLLFLGNSFFWVAFPVGFGGVLPMAVGIAKYYETRQDATRAPPGDEQSREDALEELRARYARGDISEAEFERRVETLLETESVNDAQEFVERTREREAE